MPPRKQPATLLDISLPVTALRIRNNCDAILRNYDDVTQPALKDRIESFNEQLRKEVPQVILDRIRQHHDLAVFIYFNVTTLVVQGETLRDTQIHQHLTLNVCPRLGRVTLLDLSEVEGTIDLFRAISINCPELQSIVINTRLNSLKKVAFLNTEYKDVGTWLLYLTKCKKLRAIRNTALDLGFYNSDCLQLQNCVPFWILQELPELSKFKFDITSILGKKRILSEAYKFTQLEIKYENYIEIVKHIHWLNSHCPFINQVVINFSCGVTPMHQAIFQALTLTDWRIKNLQFKLVTPEISEAMKVFFTRKGIFIENFTLVDLTFSLNHEHLLWISQCCPALKRLTFLKKWRDGDELTPQQNRTKCLFPNLEYFAMTVTDCTLNSVVLESLVNLQELKCYIIGYTIVPFLDIIAGLKNTFIHLKKVKIKVMLYNSTEVSLFVLRFVPMAMAWKNIREIHILFTENGLIPECVQYLEQVKCTIKESNLDVILNVGRGTWK